MSRCSMLCVLLALSSYVYITNYTIYTLQHLSTTHLYYHYYYYYYHYYYYY